MKPLTIGMLFVLLAMLAGVATAQDRCNCASIADPVERAKCYRNCPNN